MKKGWSLNWRVESRQLIQSGIFRDDAEVRYRYVLTDVSWIAAKKIGWNTRIAGGYLTRFRDGEIIHRFIQQFTLVQQLPGARLAHRIATDQTMAPGSAMEYRLRYRLASEFSLNGQSADAREWYVKINNEYLNSLQDREYDLEIRLVPQLGYTISEQHKIEFGLDYRVNSFLSGNTRHAFWVAVNWFVEL